MPCFNAAPYVNEAVSSVLGQTYGNVELVVVDDGSTDGSDTILIRLAEAHPGRIRLLHSNRLGPYPARNLALRQTHGEFIAFLDADDWWLPETLEKLHAALVEDDADLAIAAGRTSARGWNRRPMCRPPTKRRIPLPISCAAAHGRSTLPW